MDQIETLRKKRYYFCSNVSFEKLSWLLSVQREWQEQQEKTQTDESPSKQIEEEKNHKKFNKFSQNGGK